MRGALSGSQSDVDALMLDKRVGCRDRLFVVQLASALAPVGGITYLTGGSGRGLAFLGCGPSGGGKSGIGSFFRGHGSVQPFTGVATSNSDVSSTLTATDNQLSLRETCTDEMIRNETFRVYASLWNRSVLQPSMAKWASMPKWAKRPQLFTPRMEPLGVFWVLLAVHLIHASEYFQSLHHHSAPTRHGSARTTGKCQNLQSR